jgi:hypothetical protein
MKSYADIHSFFNSTHEFLSVAADEIEKSTNLKQKDKENKSKLIDIKTDINTLKKELYSGV